MPHDISLDGARQIISEWDEIEHLREIVETIESGLRNDSDTAVDGAKCLIEAVCKTILAERGVDIEANASPQKLIKKTTQALQIEDDEGGESLRDMVRGMAGAVQGLGNMRNDYGPLGHGRATGHQPLGDWHRLMAVRTAETIVVLLFEAHESMDLNLKYTRKEFDDESPENELIDEAVAVEFDEDSRVVVLNEFLRFRPSQILYAFDRDAYIDLLNELPDEEEQEIDDATISEQQAVPTPFGDK